LTTGSLRIALAQVNLLVGDVGGNAARLLQWAHEARAAGADLVVFPELTLAGYPPEDLLFHRGFRRQVESALARCIDTKELPAMLVGFPESAEQGIYNALSWIENGKERAR
jgi:NAD+ synthase (glutamine-hydrolysing)